MTEKSLWIHEEGGSHGLKSSLPQQLEEIRTRIFRLERRGSIVNLWIAGNPVEGINPHSQADCIILMADDGWTFYASTTLGLTQALAAAESGNTVWVPPGTYSSNYTVPAGVTVVGQDNHTTLIAGTVTMSNNSVITRLGWNQVFNDSSVHVGVQGPGIGDECVIDHCWIILDQQGPGGSRGVYIPEAAHVLIKDCHIECLTHLGHAIYLDPEVAGGADAEVHDTFTSDPYAEYYLYEDTEQEPPTSNPSGQFFWTLATTGIGGDYTYIYVDWKSIVTCSEYWGGDGTPLVCTCTIDTHPGVPSQVASQWWNPDTQQWQYCDGVVRGNTLYDETGTYEQGETLIFRIKDSDGSSPHVHLWLRANLQRAATDGIATVLASWSSDTYAGGVIVRHSSMYGVDADIHTASGVVQVQACTYRQDYVTGNGYVHPEEGDRSSWDLTTYPQYHASDISDGTPVYHWTAAQLATEIGGDIDAAINGTAGRVAQFGTGGHIVVDSTLVKDGAGVLTITAAGAYTLTVPATGTAALLEVANTFTVGPQTIQTGGAGNVGLVVQGAASQSAHLQEWLDSAGDAWSWIDHRGVLYSDCGIGGADNTTNFFAGRNAGNVASTGIQNVGIGDGALEDVTNGASNVAIGARALANITTGGYNFGLGAGAGGALIDGAYNVAIGHTALALSVSGQYNIAIGRVALYKATGNFNIGIGGSVLQNVTTGNSNVSIGHVAGGLLTTGSRNIFLGYGAGIRQTTASDLLIVDNGSRASAAVELTNSIIYGVMATLPVNQTLRLNAVVTQKLSDALTDTVGTVMFADHITSGTAAAGFGIALQMRLQSSTTEDREAGQLVSLWATATDASRKARSVWSVWDTAEREGIRIEADGSAPMIGLYGAAAVVRATTGGGTAAFVQNSGNAVNDASTFDGYTLIDVVTALRNIGVLT